eukprot:12296435-Ditylum_brightwellii.AAC.1
MAPLASRAALASHDTPGSVAHLAFCLALLACKPLVALAASCAALASHDAPSALCVTAFGSHSSCAALAVPLRFALLLCT